MHPARNAGWSLAIDQWEVVERALDGRDWLVDDKPPLLAGAGLIIIRTRPRSGVELFGPYWEKYGR